MEESKELISKKDFLKSDLTRMLSGLQPGQMGLWGKMNAQQMVEHLSEYIRIASGKINVDAQYPEDITQRSYSFMMSEKPFRENTPNKLLPDVPAPAKQESMQAAIAELQKEIDDFFEFYKRNPGMRKQSPFFGMLNFEEQVHLLHKHAVHHAMQFGLLNRA
jgi:hypothetical protein